MASHFMKFGGRLRYTRDANAANSNFNGFFTFGSRIVNGQTISALQSYQITRKALANNPNPAARGVGQRFRRRAVAPANTR